MSVLEIFLCTDNLELFHLIANDVGDVCDGDIDDDGFDDYTDDCPKHRNITVIDFKTLILIPLDPQGASQMDPRWRILNNVSL